MSSDAQFHIAENARVAALAHARMMRTGGGEALYLYFKPGAKRLEIFSDSDIDLSVVWNKEYVLAFAERLPTHLDIEQLTRWLKTRTDKVPYL